MLEVARRRENSSVAMTVRLDSRSFLEAFLLLAVINIVVSRSIISCISYVLHAVLAINHNIAIVHAELWYFVFAFLSGINLYLSTLHMEIPVHYYH